MVVGGLRGFGELGGGDFSSDSVITAELLLDKRVTYTEGDSSDGRMHPMADQKRSTWGAEQNPRKPSRAPLGAGDKARRRVAKKRRASPGRATRPR